jgi:hypothetical protein
MDANDQRDDGAHEGKGRSAKARTKPSKPKPEAVKRSLNLRVDEAAYQRLSVHAMMKRTTVSALVEEYAETLREFVVHRRSPGGSEAQG